MRWVVEIENGYSISEGVIRITRVYEMIGKTTAKNGWPTQRAKFETLISLEPTDIGAAEQLTTYFKYLKQEAEKVEVAID